LKNRDTGQSGKQAEMEAGTPEREGVGGGSRLGLESGFQSCRFPLRVEDDESRS